MAVRDLRDIIRRMLAAGTYPPVVMLVAIIVIGGVAQWLAWRIKLPSILLLLISGFVAGPVTLFLNPDELFGDLLRPFVSLSVAIILFEGGLSLTFSGLRGSEGVVRNLVTIGLVATWAVVTLSARFIVNLDWSLALLLGAILVVTGPTVILPLLRHVRPIGPTGSILKWEGIVIDPIGVLVAVLVFEIVLGDEGSRAPLHIAAAVAKTCFAGGGLGIMAAGVLVLALKRYWIPEQLQSAVTLVLVTAVFAGANLLQDEAGLMAVTVMGITLANQRYVDLKHIVEFKENLRVVLLSTLFILLSARLRREDLQAVGWQALLFVAAVILLARPLCVWISTLRSSLKRSERTFLMCMAPRGIVAASMSSVFAIDLDRAGYHEARLIVPLTFLTIVSTVLIYGLTAAPIARSLGLAVRDPQGLLIVGAHAFARQIAAAVRQAGIPVMLVDTNTSNIAAARLEGLPVFLGNILGERTLDELNLAGVGRLLAMTPNDEVNILAVQRFVPVFGRASTYQLAPKAPSHSKQEVERHLRGRTLFTNDASYAALNERIDNGYVVKTTNLTESFDFQQFQAMYGPDALPLFVIQDSSRLTVIDSQTRLDPKPGVRLTALVRGDAATQATGSASTSTQSQSDGPG